MKHLIIIIWVALALMSCASSKKATRKVEKLHSVDSIAMSESVVRKSLFDFDTTFTKDVSITITEIEYFPPGDDGSKYNANAEQMQSKKPLRGGIRRIKQTSIDANVKGEGHTKVGDTLNVSKQQIQNRKKDKSNIKEQMETKRTFHWWWYYVVLFGVIALLYIARAPILNFIRKILTGCRRIL